MILYEPCAGSAAVSLRALDQRPLSPYMGAKAKFAKAILHHMGVRGHPERVVLGDPGPWGDFWRTLPGNRDAIVAWLDRRMAEETDHGALWRTVAAEGVPDDPVARAGAFVVLQNLSWRSKPVGVNGTTWRTMGLNITRAYGWPKTQNFGAMAPVLPAVVRRLRQFPRRALARISGGQTKAEDLDPLPGAVVYLDPPYSGTKGYAHDLSRAQVIELSRRWVGRGARVALSEGEPVLDEPFVRWVRVGSRQASGLKNGGDKTEWLSLSWPAAQAGLFAGGAT